MRWIDQAPDARPRALAELTATLGGVSALNLLANLATGARIYALRSCFDSVSRHCASDRHEVGGLLLGFAFRVDVESNDPTRVVTLLTRSLSSAQSENSPVSLRMEAEVWTRSNQHFEAGEIVVGWYHSHPHLGAFFSHTDRTTQKAFFNHQYSVGWVIDPYGGEDAVFCGGECDLYNHPVTVLPDTLLVRLRASVGKLAEGADSKTQLGPQKLRASTEDAPAASGECSYEPPKLDLESVANVGQEDHA